MHNEDDGTVYIYIYNSQSAGGNIRMRNRTGIIASGKMLPPRKIPPILQSTEVNGI